MDGFANFINLHYCDFRHSLKVFFWGGVIQQNQFPRNLGTSKINYFSPQAARELRYTSTNRLAIVVRVVVWDLFHYGKETTFIWSFRIRRSRSMNEGHSSPPHPFPSNVLSTFLTRAT